MSQPSGGGVTDGWRPGPPDFVGIGAQGSGTTWWYHLICEHPRIVPAVRKEIHFFDARWHHRRLGERQVGAYHDCFPRPPGALCGEWTPRYMVDVGTMPRLRRAAPDAKLLVLLRDPIDRLRSNLAHVAAKGGQVDATTMVGASERGRYAAALGRVLRHYPRDQLLVLQFERCLLDPFTEIGRTYQFLGVDPAFRPSFVADEARQNRHPNPVELPADLQEELVLGYYADDIGRLAREWPELDLGLWPNVAPLL